ncbi:MAG: hypothetical protein H0T42_29495 [Deltaproteobacteria bacterium]|nr:hypothetical protein [Deltaproteobacteria bacterium]
MRRQIAPSLIRYVLIALAFVLVGNTHSFADGRSEARTHYQAGVKYYNGGDYRSAIREFSAAQQLLPADLNNYNLALCYDKLGDPEPAVQYYRAYIEKVPNTDKRAEIEASIARLDAAAKSVAQKKADELRKIDEAKRAEEERKAYEQGKRADAERKAEEARLAAEARRRPPADPASGGDGGPAVGVGSTGVPSSGTVSTGDEQLDRVQGMSIDQVRDQRVGAAGSGMVDPRGGPATAANGGMAPPPVGNGAPPVAAAAPVAGQPAGPQDQPKKADPVYKKWWFWAVVVVGLYVTYQIATTDSNDNVTRTMLPIGPSAPPAQSGGYTLMRW